MQYRLLKGKLEDFLNDKLSLSIVKATESAAIAAYKVIGKNDEFIADKLAVEAMRTALNVVDMEGTVVIGEGERDQAPMLYIGEKVGSGKGPKLDVALDPLECTTMLATGKNNALSVIAITESGGFLNAPDVYMDKIAVGFNFPEPLFDLDTPPYTILKNIALAKKCKLSDLLVVILDRKRHIELIAKVRKAGAKVKLIKDGDVEAIITTALPNNSADVYMGIGGAPEGVLAAAALKTLGGQICGRLLFNNDADRNKAKKMGITDYNKQYNLNDMALGNVIFAATGVTKSSILEGVKITPISAITNSIVMKSKTKTIIKLETQHLLNDHFGSII